MTSIIERAVAIIAPHQCIVCGIEYNVLCETCAVQLTGTAESVCAGCGAVSQDFATCSQCYLVLPLDYIWVGGPYAGALETAIRKLKFERAQAAATVLGRALAARLPIFDSQTVVVPLPTTPRRVRQRGYDQAVKLAQALSLELSLPVQSLLARAHDQRQLGASRVDRFIQAEQAFYIPNPGLCKSKDILLVDDVMTTGASLASAARLLAKAGARSVSAVVVARQAAHN